MAACNTWQLPEKPKRQNGDVAGPAKCDPGRSTKHLCFTPLGHHAASVCFWVKTNVVLLVEEILHQLFIGFHTSQVVQDFSHQQYEVYNIFKALFFGGVHGGVPFWCLWELISKNQWLRWPYLGHPSFLGWNTWRCSQKSWKNTIVWRNSEKSSHVKSSPQKTHLESNLPKKNVYWIQQIGLVGKSLESPFILYTLSPIEFGGNDTMSLTQS